MELNVIKTKLWYLFIFLLIYITKSAKTPEAYCLREKGGKFEKTYERKEGREQKNNKEISVYVSISNNFFSIIQRQPAVSIFNK